MMCVAKDLLTMENYSAADRVRSHPEKMGSALVPPTKDASLQNFNISENYRMKWHQISFELSLEWYLVDGTVCDLSSITFLQLSDIANANARNFFIHV